MQLIFLVSYIKGQVFLDEYFILILNLLKGNAFEINLWRPRIKFHIPTTRMQFNIILLQPSLYANTK